MKTMLRTAILLLAALPLHASDPVIARSGDRDITASQIRPYLSGLGDAEREALEKNPAALSQAVRTLILQQLLLKEATAAGWDKSPEIAGLLARVRDAAIAESYLENVAKVPAGYPSEAETRELYELRKSDLRLPRQYRLAQIFIAAAPDKTAAKSEAESLLKEAKSGDFAALAKSKSDEPRSAAEGGEIGWLAEESVQPAVRKAVTGAAKEAILGPIELGDGFYIVKVLDIREPRTASYDEVKEKLAAALRQERAALNRQSYLQRLQSESPVTLNEIALPALLKP
jgi:parvulin-like peptidyl-prolyl isomerase